MKQKIVKYFIRLIWILSILIVLGIPSVFLMVRSDAFGWFGGLPSLQALERPDPDLSSELMSVDGVSLGKYFRKNRTPVTYEELSPELVNTLLVTEDIRFKNHSGIDLRGLTRAVFGLVTFNFKGGGSTITMQLAENLYRTNSENQGSLYRYENIGRLITKLKEWIIAVQLEQSYTKEEILAMYLNTVEYGSNSYGVKVAAKTFFNKLPSQLDYQEAASLIGSINKPTKYNPVFSPEYAKNKRTEVLYNLYKYDVINRSTFDSLDNRSLPLNYRVNNQNQGLATYFRTVARNDLSKWARQNGYELNDDGLKIYTTIDSRLQQYAEQAMEEHMKALHETFSKHWKGSNPWINDKNKEILGFLETVMKGTLAYRSLKNRFGKNSDSIEFYLNKKKNMNIFSWDGEIDTLFSSYDSLGYYKRFMQSGFMAMDPKTGHIKAWVGGINHKYFKFDHVMKGKRQPGSIFKPIVYAKAIQSNYSPCLTAVDAPITITLPNQDPPTWSPKNSNNKFSGEIMTIRQAMARSVNSITAWMIDRLKPQNVVDMAKDLGIESYLDPVHSLALGAGGDVSLYEMLGAYSTFANNGRYTKPYFISRIEDKNGNVIQQFVPEQRDVINEETAYIMLHMLMGTTTERGGTALGLASELRNKNEIGAKTGTTQNASDGWFIGITKDLVAGAWTGGDNRSIRFRNWIMGQGARTAMPIWEKFMTKVYADKSLGYEKGNFERPSTPLTIEIDCEKHNQSMNPSDSVSFNSVSEDDFL